MSSPPPPPAPKEIPLVDRLKAATAGRYHIHAELGVGGMATVYRATEIALEREVAIKVMSFEMASTPGAVERFRREARVAAALSHPHIVPIYAIGEDPALAFFAMKFIEGRGLDSILKKAGAQPVGNVAQTISVVGRALHHAHAHGVVHRDVKPANIMVGNDGWVYVTDFGIAKRDDAQGLTQAGTVIGTPAYMSPEQFNGQAVTGSADQYSLGVVAYEMLAGRTPFDAPSLGEIMRGHLLEPPPPLRTVRNDIPTAVAEVVNRMLAKEPSQRFESLGEAVAALEEAAKQAPSRNTVPSGRASSRATVHPSMSPTTPIPKSNPASVISGATSTAARRQSTGAQPRQVEEPKRGGLGIVLFVLLAIGGGGAYVMRDDLMPMLLPDRQPTVIAPSPDTMAAPAPSPDAAAAPAESTRVATKDSSEQVIDTAIANLAVRLATALAIDMMAPPESVVVRVGSQTPETVLFINGQQVGPVGNRGLIPTTVAPGAVLVAIKKLNCRDWDTTLTALAGRRYTFVERSPRC